MSNQAPVAQLDRARDFIGRADRAVSSSRRKAVGKRRCRSPVEALAHRLDEGLSVDGFPENALGGQMLKRSGSSGHHDDRDGLRIHPLLYLVEDQGAVDER